MVCFCNLIKTLVFLFCITVPFLLVGCQAGSDSGGGVLVSVKGYEFKYSGNIGFQNVPLKVDDSEDIIALYQEEGNDLAYRDSLLIAEEYVNGVGANVFIKDNLEILEKQGLVLSNINKKQIGFRKGGENVSAVLLEYEITEGLVPEIPLLYVSQLFIPGEDNMLMLSYITENSSSRKSVSNMFKNIH